MRIRDRFEMVVITLGLMCGGVTSLAQANGSTQRDRVAIEQLHQQDIDATLSGKAADLARLWDTDAVRIGPGDPVEIGKAAIYTTDKLEEAPTLCYKPEIKNLQIAADWAFEWGYFSYRQSANTKPGRGKVLRVIKRQPDGSWKFARVMVFEEKNDSAVPMSHPCE